MNPDPYAPPLTAETLAPDPDSRFGELDDKAFKKLYYRSCNVTGIAFLLGLALLAIVGAATLVRGEEGVFNTPILIGLAAFYLVTLIGLIKRTSWGRILGIIVCVLSLISIPIGTIIGIMGLFAFIGAPNLFGPDRIPHKELKAEFKMRKKRRKHG